MDYIIVQAGGKGTRLGYLTKNKPKAITPVDNLPMLFYLFRKYPKKKFIIIADYKKDVIRHKKNSAIPENPRFKYCSLRYFLKELGVE